MIVGWPLYMAALSLPLLAWLWAQSLWVWDRRCRRGAHSRGDGDVVSAYQTWAARRLLPAMVTYPPANHGAVSRTLGVTGGSWDIGERSMRRYRLEIDNNTFAFALLWVVIGLQGLIILALWVGWSQAPNSCAFMYHRICAPGAVLTAEEVPPANVYAFAFYIFSSSTAGPESSATDYGNDFRISPYLTPRYRNDLIEDMG